MQQSGIRGDALGGLAVLALIVLALAGVLALVGLLLILLYYEHCALTRATPSSVRDFDATDAEVEELLKIRPVLEAVRSDLDKVYRTGAHLKRRKDGLFYESSGLAHKLNPHVRKLQAERRRLERRSHGLETAPQRRLQEWVAFKTTHLGLRTTLVVCAGCLLLLVTLQPAWLLFLSGFLDRFSVFGFMTETPALTGAVLVAFLTGGVTLLLKGPLFGWWVKRQLASPS